MRNGKANCAPVAFRREGVAAGKFIQCRFPIPGDRNGKTAVGMAVVREVHPDKLVVKVFGGTAQADPVIEVDRLQGEWRLLYP